MAKAKQKREKKEQEKLRRAGRHLEWLVTVQGQVRTPELGREIDQAWQEVLRRTLRTRQAFDEFCAQIDSIPAAPQTAEMAFLLSLKGCMAGDVEAADAFLAVGGLAGLTGGWLAPTAAMLVCAVIMAVVAPRAASADPIG